MTAMPRASSPIHAFEGFASPGGPASGTVTSVASQALRLPVRAFTDSGELRRMLSPHPPLSYAPGLTHHHRELGVLRDARRAEQGDVKALGGTARQLYPRNAREPPAGHRQVGGTEVIVDGPAQAIDENGQVIVRHRSTLRRTSTAPVRFDRTAACPSTVEHGIGAGARRQDPDRDVQSQEAPIGGPNRL
jgi:hypothetical protein